MAIRKFKSKKEIVKVDGVLHELVTIRDEESKVLHKILTPLKVEFLSKDVLEVIVGATLLSIPIGFTGEVWQLGGALPLLNILVFLVLSFLFLSIFSYHVYYRGTMRKHYHKFATRVLSTYLISFVVVGILLTVIQQAPWSTDIFLAIKRTIIATFPAAMSGALVDTLK